MSDKSEQESCKKPERPGKPGQKTLTSFVNDKESEVQQSTCAMYLYVPVLDKKVFDSRRISHLTLLTSAVSRFL